MSPFQVEGHKQRMHAGADMEGVTVEGRASGHVELGAPSPHSHMKPESFLGATDDNLYLIPNEYGISWYSARGEAGRVARDLAAFYAKMPINALTVNDALVKDRLNYWKRQSEFAKTAVDAFDLANVGEAIEADRERLFKIAVEACLLVMNAREKDKRCFGQLKELFEEKKAAWEAAYGLPREIAMQGGETFAEFAKNEKIFKPL